ncbi:MAG: DUF115 domain-containing protein [Candidatus Rhabdochlamydia sp.]
MGEVLCLMGWDLRKEKQFLPWILAQKNRYLIVIEGADTPIHPQIYAINPDPVAFYQVAKELIFLPFSYEETSHPVLMQLKQIQEEIQDQASDFMDQGVKILSNCWKNLLTPFASLEPLYGTFTHTPAIICGAAPSLNPIIPLLKQLQSSCLIIGCGSGVKALLAQGITPHLAVHVDGDCTHILPPHTFPLCFQLRTDPQTVELAQGPRLLIGSRSTFPLIQWIEEKLGIFSQEPGGWTSTTRAAALAYELGCPQIYLAGIDFAYGSSPYALGVTGSLEGCMHVQLDQNRAIKTKRDWVLAASWLEAFVQDHLDVEWNILGNSNPLMPLIPFLSPEEGVMKLKRPSSLPLPDFQSLQEQSNQGLYAEIMQLAEEINSLLDAILSRYERLFPQMPKEDEVLQKLIHELHQKKLTQLMLLPIWEIWEPVFRRERSIERDHLLLHQVLLFQTLMQSFHVG